MARIADKVNTADAFKTPETDLALEPARKPQRRPIHRSLIRPSPRAIRATLRLFLPVRPQ